MKYIFRYSLLSNFPNKDSKITEEELSEALQSVKFDFDKFDINYLEELCLNCVDKFLTRPQEKVISVIEDVFGSGDRAVPEFTGRELENIWEQEKVNVYKSLISGSCGSSFTFKDMEWSVKNIIMRRSQSWGRGNNIMTRLKINCVEKGDCGEESVSLIINASRKGFERMYSSLEECQNVINEVLLSEE